MSSAQERSTNAQQFLEIRATGRGSAKRRASRAASRGRERPRQAPSASAECGCHCRRRAKSTSRRAPQQRDRRAWAVPVVRAVDALPTGCEDEAVRFVQAMRYPPMRGAAQPEPRGERGWGPGGAMRLWGMGPVDYHRKADVGPLNPEGELFAVAMIESQEAVGNIHEILEAPVSAIMVVPGDMAIDLGLGPNPSDRNHAEVDEAFATVLRACQAQARVISGCGDSSSRTQQRLDEGGRFVLPLGGWPNSHQTPPS